MIDQSPALWHPVNLICVANCGFPDIGDPWFKQGDLLAVTGQHDDWYQSINLSINQSINQSIDQSILCSMNDFIMVKSQQETI